jgi:OFA family oxalate/formate antiporter-like MFS transporter
VAPSNGGAARSSVDGPQGTSTDPLRVRRWPVAIAGTAMQIALGAVYAWSVFRKPLAVAFGASVTAVNVAFTITIVMLGVGAFLGGLVLGKVGPRAVGIASGILYGAGTFLSSYAAGDLDRFYLTYGVIAGFGLGLGYIVPIATLVKWFPDKRGMITGVAVAGFGCGALLFGPLARTLVDVWGPFRTFQLLGVVFYVIVIGSAIVLRDPPVRALARNVRGRSLGDRRLGDALRTWQWYALWTLLFLNVTAGISIIAEAAPMAQELGGASEVQAAALVGTIAIFNGLGRLVWAALSDMIGRRAVFVLLFLGQATVFFLLSQAHTYDTFLVLTCVGLLCYGGGFGTMPAFAADYFGARDVGKIYGLMLTAWGAGALLGPTMLSRLRDSTGGYSAGLHAIAAIMLVSAVVPLLVRAPNRPPPEPVTIRGWPTRAGRSRAM